MSVAADELSEIAIKLREVMDQKQKKQFKLKTLKSCADLISSLDEDCYECDELIDQLNDILLNVMTDVNNICTDKKREFNKKYNKLSSHLQKKHKIVQQGYYTMTYISLGISLGLPLGLLFDNISIGLIFGICIGILAGSLMDTDAKKKGRSY